MEVEYDRLASENHALHALSLEVKPLRKLRVTTESTIENAARAAVSFTTPLNADPDVLGRRVVEYESEETGLIASVEEFDEAIDERHGGYWPPRPRLAVGLAEACPAAVEGGLHRANGSLEHLSTFLQIEVEDVLQQHRRALAGGQAVEQVAARIASLPARPAVFPTVDMGVSFGDPLALAPSKPVDP
jgi:hypothetical protein